ncbi:MAG: DinB family protein [Acidobacteriota bacterium]
MNRKYMEFESARAVRRQTLSRVQDLDQKQADYRPGRGKWSVGEVLDHLVKLDDLIVRELGVAIERRRLGLPFVYRGIADIDTTLPWVLKPVLPFFEVPFSIFNTAVPQPVRRALTGNRRIPVQAPKIIEPRFGRPIETLRRELDSTFSALEQQQAENPRIDLNRVYYYNPITGLASVAGLYRFVSNHEQRHQKQLHDILQDGSFPTTESDSRAA